MAKGATLEEALADHSALGTYRDHPVIKTSIAITNAGDGLSKSMSIDPVTLEPGDEVMVLMKCTVDRHGFSLIPDTDCFELKQYLKAGTATIVSDQASERKLRAAENNVRKEAERRAGVARLAGTEDAIDGKDDDDPDDDPEV